MTNDKIEPIEPGRNVARMLGSLWSSGGLLWAMATAVVAAIVLGMATLSSVTTSILLLQSEKVDATQVLLILDRELKRDNIHGALEAIKTSNADFSSRLRKIEVELSRLTAIVEERIEQ